MARKSVPKIKPSINLAISRKLIRVARQLAQHELSTNPIYKKAYKRAVDLFETEIGATDWFMQPLSAFNGLTPEHCCSKGRAEEVINLLGRIEHGVY